MNKQFIFILLDINPIVVLIKGNLLCFCNYRVFLLYVRGKSMHLNDSIIDIQCKYRIMII